VEENEEAKRMERDVMELQTDKLGGQLPEEKMHSVAVRSGRRKKYKFERETRVLEAQSLAEDTDAVKKEKDAPKVGTEEPRVHIKANARMVESLLCAEIQRECIAKRGNLAY
jgi:hypothetical protein